MDRYMWLMIVWNEQMRKTHTKSQKSIQTHTQLFFPASSHTIFHRTIRTLTVSVQCKMQQMLLFNSHIIDISYLPHTMHCALHTAHIPHTQADFEFGFLLRLALNQTIAIQSLGAKRDKFQPFPFANARNDCRLCMA